MEAVNVSDIKGTPRAATSASIAANSPSEAVTHASAASVVASSSSIDLSSTQFTSDLEVFGSLGDDSSGTLTWTKISDNLWSVSVSNPVASTDSTDTTGSVTSGAGFMVGFTLDNTIDRHLDEQLTIQSHAEDIKNVDLAAAETKLSQLEALMSANTSAIKAMRTFNLNELL